MDYRKLFKDKAEGKISDEMVIVFDNDGGYWISNNPILSEAEEMQKEYEERYGEPDGKGDVVDIMQGAGFNAEWC